MSTSSRDKYRKITDFAKKLTTPRSTVKESRSTPKCPISPTNPSDLMEEEKSAKQARIQSPTINMESDAQDHNNTNESAGTLENPTLQAALGPLVRESNS